MIGYLVLFTLLPFAQAASAPPPPPVEQARLRACLDEARTDPATAIATASQWAGQTTGEATGEPQQCLGFAYMSLLKWEAAEQAFVAARDARLATDRAARARLGAMAGNAALARADDARASALLADAQTDALAAGLGDLVGVIAADRTRALVGTGREADARMVLEDAQIAAPQNADIWLLSATLARRDGDLTRAQALIETAAALAPDDPETALEAGLIAAMSGRDDAARANWNRVVSIAPDSPQSVTARLYLARLNGNVEAR